MRHVFEFEKAWELVRVDPKWIKMTTSSEVRIEEVLQLEFVRCFGCMNSHWPQRRHWWHSGWHRGYLPTTTIARTQQNETRCKTRGGTWDESKKHGGNESKVRWAQFNTKREKWVETSALLVSWKASTGREWAKRARTNDKSIVNSLG